MFEERSDGVLVKAKQVDGALRARFQGSGLASGLLEDRASEPK